MAQIVQNRFLRMAQDAPWFIRNTQLHRELEMPPLKEYLQQLAEKFFARAADHSNDLVRQSVDYDPADPYWRYRRPKAVLLNKDDPDERIVSRD